MKGFANRGPRWKGSTVQKKDNELDKGRGRRREREKARARARGRAVALLFWLSNLVCLAYERVGSEVKQGPWRIWLGLSFLSSSIRITIDDCFFFLYFWDLFVLFSPFQLPLFCFVHCFFLHLIFCFFVTRRCLCHPCSLFLGPKLGYLHRSWAWMGTPRRCLSALWLFCGRPGASSFGRSNTLIQLTSPETFSKGWFEKNLAERTRKRRGCDPCLRLLGFRTMLIYICTDS